MLRTFNNGIGMILIVDKKYEKDIISEIEKHDLPFTLISDTDKKVQMAYGVWQEKSLYGRKFMGTVRTTFVISPEQKIAFVFNKIDCPNHAEEILDQLEEIGLI